MEDLNVACGQFAAKSGAKKENVARMIKYAAEAREKGCVLIVFPELIVTGYLAPEQIIPLAEPITGPSVQSLARAAQDLGIAIAFGFAELDERRDVRYNSLVILDRQGQIAGVYHKTHLWDQEKTWAESGSSIPVFDVDGVRCGGWICYDTRFPEVGRLVGLGGADVALVATAWLGPREEWELALRARALDNSIFVAGADIIITVTGLRCVGASMIVAPKGNVLARAELGKEGIIHAVLKRQDLEAQRNRVPLLRDRRPDLCGQLIQ